MKINYAVSIPVSIFKEGKYYIASSPVLDLSTSAKTFEAVKKRFGEAVDIFFEELIAKGTLDEVLCELGWQKKEKNWVPPVLIAHESKQLNLPIRIQHHAISCSN